MEDAKKLEREIGYEFKDCELLIQALTHSSYANENKRQHRKDNERLEFLGDAVLELVSSEFLFEKYSKYPEGKLTKLRASLVCEPTLADVANVIRLGNYISLGKGEDATGGRNRKSVLSDALEALIGAIYLDGGFANAKEFILRFILTDIEHKQLFYDSKTILQEYVQANYSEPLSYRLVSESGPDHNKVFVVEAYIGEEKVGLGEGHSKKNAQQQAAYKALLLLQNK
ncbi:ribonuclease III [Eubacterium oxidoreducens]|uniref:Ribonuclease 3 n=1 Tax=Eubacterium oxidoreducens TaxID=1732 RepID=A0A1G6BH73_EUBOX|nr:ribonuclease III [Eubacterium oxidoreducens]SDB19956.1 ribonuclease-3 [Eubacterium oxidoreducens]